jgi:hypothetical protein
VKAAVSQASFRLCLFDRVHTSVTVCIALDVPIRAAFLHSYCFVRRFDNCGSVFVGILRGLNMVAAYSKDSGYIDC